jgi:probable rRNA maturation factor
MKLEIAIEADEEWDSSRSWKELARTAAEAAIAESQYPDLATVRPVEISIRLTSDAQVQALNAEWRGKDKPTNVLSFPMAEPYELQAETFIAREMLLGDIILAHGVCAREASEKGIALSDHAAHLMVHGTLHLLGYDHHDDNEAADMEAREVRALKRLGIANPYEVTA